MERWIQITDIHIGRADEDTYGIDVRSNFQRSLAAARRLHPTRIVLTGDLCFREPEPEAYAWILGELQATGISFTVLPGNHDSTEAVIEHFGAPGQLDDGTLGFALDLGARRVLFLDTASSHLSQDGLAFLADNLGRGDASPIAFIHHPPLLGGVPFMDDNHALKNHPEVLDTLMAAKRHVSVFCGHYHVERSVRRGLVDVFLTPSTFFQISAETKGFSVDHQRPAIRWIELDDADLRTGVKYLET